MEKTHSYDIHENNGELMALRFGRGGAGQQEAGIKRLLDMFGIGEGETDSTKVPENVVCFRTKKLEQVLIVNDVSAKEEVPDVLKLDEGKPESHTKMAWDDHSFAIITKDFENMKRIKKLYEAIQNNNVSLVYDDNEEKTGRKELYVGITSNVKDIEWYEEKYIVEEMFLGNINKHKERQMKPLEKEKEGLEL